MKLQCTTKQGSMQNHVLRVSPDLHKIESNRIHLYINPRVDLPINSIIYKVKPLQRRSLVNFFQNFRWSIGEDV